MESCFLGCISLKKLEIPPSVTTIESGAFTGCDVLTIEISNPLFTKQDGILYTQYHKKMLFCEKKLQTLAINDNVTEISNSFFQKYKALKSVTLPKSLVTFADLSFDGCSNLTSVVIPSLPTSKLTVGAGAFRSCSSLQRVVFGDRLSITIGWYVFYGCKSLKTVTFGVITKTIYFCPIAFAFCTSLKKITLPLQTNNIGYCCFQNTKLESLEIKSGQIGLNVALGYKIFLDTPSLKSLALDIPNISPNAFENTPGLETLSLGPTTKLLDVSCFSTCPSLNTVSFDENIRNLVVNGFSFAYCTSMTSFQFPSDPLSFEANAFAHCSALQTITVKDSANYTTLEDGILYTKDLSTLVVCPGGKLEARMSPNSTKIGAQALYGCIIEKMAFSRILKVISERCFFECSELREVNIPVSTRKVEKSAFKGCSKLQKVFFCGNSSEQIDFDQGEGDPFTDITQIYVRADYHGEKFLGKKVVKSSAIDERDGCPLRPSDRFSTKNQKRQSPIMGGVQLRSLLVGVFCDSPVNMYFMK